ncbi:MAG: hypothetical protein F6J93_24770 [Oscillatoria sp. SIO1A7]|nr:hypothetical protein [Oscillatoria sp. SIO1A7]
MKRRGDSIPFDHLCCITGILILGCNAGGTSHQEREPLYILKKPGFAEAEETGFLVFGDRANHSRIIGISNKLLAVGANGYSP